MKAPGKSHRFKNGDKVRLLFQGTVATVESETSDTSGWTSYNLKLEDGKLFTCGADDIAYGEDPLFVMVQECKMVMRDNGYNSIALGIDKDNIWRIFYFDSLADYQRIHRENNDIKFKYYWSLNLPEEQRTQD
ncbi:MAG TPA: hypothetical protein VGQ59_03540 [Cyclobacteriaceae bacterium]|jgi:hypothetical protein|nr:hypothetical protein [Cyclobacteriaceae bacterium]